MIEKLGTNYRIIKVINNNIVRVYDSFDQEIILIGKGIGFNKKGLGIISSENVENFFILKNKQEQLLYSQLLETTSPKLISIVTDIISYIQSQVDKPLNEHIHIALTDHIAFLVRRCQIGLPIENPFLYETLSLYPKEALISEQVVEILKKKLNLDIPRGEVGFITLHIMSSLKNDTYMNVQKATNLIGRMTMLIQEELGVTIDKQSLDYNRFITHIHFAIERVQRNEAVKMPNEIINALKKHKQIYAIATKLYKIMQEELNTKLDNSEICYLALHLHRFESLNPKS